MNNFVFCRTHIHRAALLIAFYGFALSLLNSKAILAIIFNVANVFTSNSGDTEMDNVMNTARRVYFLFSQSAPDSRGLVYVNIFVAGVACILLAYGNRELRPGYYWPFIAFCIYKMMYCSSEVLEATMIILHRVPMLQIEHQASTTHLILCVGTLTIIILFIWAYFMDIVFRAKRFMQEDLLDPFTRLPRVHGTLLSTVQIGQASNLPPIYANPTEEIPPPPFDWKPGQSVQRTLPAPAYHP